MENQAINESNTHKVVNILNESSEILENLTSFAGELGVTLAQINDIRGRTRNEGGNNYELLSRIIRKWISNNGRSATVERLASILRQQNFNADAVDNLESQFGLICTNSTLKINSEFGIWFDVPDLPDNFTGREAVLTELHDEITKNQGLSLTVISQLTNLTGLGGVGKTTLAIKYAEKYCSSYKNVIWINAQTRDSMLSSIKRLAEEKLDINIKTQGERKILDDIFSKIGLVETLLIFDNAEAVDGRNGLKRFLPSKKSPDQPPDKLHILVTSRNSGLSRRVFELDVFTSAEAIQFIKGEIEIDVNSKEEEAEVAELVEELGRLPLALSHAVAMMKMDRPELSNGRSAVANYLHQYKIIKKDLLNTERDDSETTVYLTWKITLNKIQEDKLYGEMAFKLIKQLAYMNPDDIPITCLEKFEEQSENTTSEADDERRKYKIRGGLFLLKQYSMIKMPDKKPISIHRLVQQVLMFDIEKPEELEILKCGLKLVGKHLSSTENDFDPNYYSVEDNKCIPHAGTLCEHFLSQEANEELLTSFPNVPVNLSYAMQINGQYEKAHTLAIKFTELYARELGEEDLSTIRIKERLANSFEYAGEFEKSEEIYRSVYAISKEKYGLEKRLNLIIGQNYALVLFRREKYAEAWAVLKELLSTKIGAGAYGEVDTKVIDQILTHGSRLQKLQCGLQLQAKIEYAQHPSLMETQFQIALELEDIEQFDEALKILESLETNRISVLGLQHKQTIDTRNAIRRIKNRQQESGGKKCRVDEIDG